MTTVFVRLHLLLSHWIHCVLFSFHQVVYLTKNRSKKQKPGWSDTYFSWSFNQTFWSVGYLRLVVERWLTVWVAFFSVPSDLHISPILHPWDVLHHAITIFVPTGLYVRDLLWWENFYLCWAWLNLSMFHFLLFVAWRECFFPHSKYF